MNNYLILSNDKVIIDTNIKDIVKNIKDDDKEIIKMDLSINSLNSNNSTCIIFPIWCASFFTILFALLFAKILIKRK